MIRLDLRRNPYNRYLFALVFALTRAGHQVRATPRPLFVADVEGEMYARGIVDLPSFSWARRHPFERSTTLGDSASADIQLDLDYFRSSTSPAEVHLPIGQHPLMYTGGFWNSPIDMDRERSRIAVFAGNIDVALYADPRLTERFGVTPRHTLATAARPELVDIRDARFQMVPRTEWRELLQTHAFFLAFPGCMMPHAHNLTEAMSAGCVPIIQRAYAAWMHPPLEHGVDAWLFDGVDDFNDRLLEASRLDESALRRVREGVLEYHRRWLSPEATVSLLFAPGVTTAFVMAEGPSVAARCG